ncbi:ABC transporter ATP-binding protein [Thioflexithrix psekupsensis]|uniref:ABC transporter ATP-binding protein n=1 Tax=Thioflexithrix psekupsensis TaxID=1570016 RepID=A0A251X3B9_9GAMM|nr:ATP-binding cassette domain-containing protein [Thioflexithrix psekupsensis]OUD11662.1 ABC transporter ATP-binding protein [Thioflexithrix psekupsensis]
MSAVIEVRHLKTQLGEHLIHEDVSFDVHQGDIMGIIGGSGTGKSVLLREITRLIKPVSGSIKIFGEEILNRSENETAWIRRQCGIMFQNGALFSALTVAENVAVPLQEHTQLSPRLIAEIAAYKIALVGLPPSAANKYPSQLSGGMIKRASVARALALDAHILFLDEPTAGLDPVGAGALDELILQLRDLLGLTVVLVTHDLDSLWKVTNKITVLAEKKVLTVAPIQTLITMDYPWLIEYFQGARGRVATQEYSWTIK